jgi:hypothetical protein
MKPNQQVLSNANFPGERRPGNCEFGHLRAKHLMFKFNFISSFELEASECTSLRYRPPPLPRRPSELEFTQLTCKRRPLATHMASRQVLRLVSSSCIAKKGRTQLTLTARLSACSGARSSCHSVPHENGTC